MSPSGFPVVSPDLGGVCVSFGGPGVVVFIGGWDGFEELSPVVEFSPEFGSLGVVSPGIGSLGFAG